MFVDEELEIIRQLLEKSVKIINCIKNDIEKKKEILSKHRSSSHYFSQFSEDVDDFGGDLLLEVSDDANAHFQVAQQLFGQSAGLADTVNTLESLLSQTDLKDFISQLLEIIKQLSKIKTNLEKKQKIILDAANNDFSIGTSVEGLVESISEKGRQESLMGFGIAMLKIFIGNVQKYIDQVGKASVRESNPFNPW